MTKKIIQARVIPVTSNGPSAYTIDNNRAHTITKNTHSPPVQKKQRTPRFIEYDPCNTGRRKLEVPPRDIEKYLSLTQASAAAKLNISVSTLKRRFYSFSQSRWPRKSKFPITVASKDPDELEAIVHDPQIQSFVNSHTTIGRVSSVQQLLNRQEMDTKWIDHTAEAQLLHAFSQQFSSQV